LTPAPRSALDCGGWPKSADESAAHPLRIAKAVKLRNPFDRLAGGLHALARTSIRKRSTAFDGVEPVSAMKSAGEMPRHSMPACSAESSTVSGASRCSRAQASNSGAKRPLGAFNVQQRPRELRLAAAAAVVEHELARGLLRDLVPKSSDHHRQRQIDSRAVIPL
jgi:hypothetical protein